MCDNFFVRQYIKNNKHMQVWIKSYSLTISPTTFWHWWIKFHSITHHSFFFNLIFYLKFIETVTYCLQNIQVIEKIFRENQTKRHKIDLEIQESLNLQPFYLAAVWPLVVKLTFFHILFKGGNSILCHLIKD